MMREKPTMALSGVRISWLMLARKADLSWSEVSAFSHGLFTTIRASRGEDIFAACGMLSTAKQEENKQELI